MSGKAEAVREEPEIEQKNGGAQVWAIGGGKGGTGKSFVTSSLGVTLAGRGSRVVLLDADLGGANLHSFLGIKRPRQSLTDFFERGRPLRDLVVDSGVERMGLVTGDVHSLASDSVKFTQKLKLFRHIRNMEADYVLIDLGAGSHNNTLDTFLLADRMVVVTVPEITAIENLYHFIKNVFFRRLKDVLGEHGLKDAALEVWKNRDSHGIRNLRELVDHLRSSRPGLGEVLDRELGAFSIHLVLNQVRSSGEVSIGASVRSVFRKFLGFQTLYTGYVEYDDAIWRCTNRGQPYMLACPTSNCAKEMRLVLERLLTGQQIRGLK
jgi:flagellar biosynthesis protein FlhG